MGWTKSEPEWDREVNVPDAHDNDNAHNGRRLYRDHFGIDVTDSNVASGYAALDGYYEQYER